MTVKGEQGDVERLEEGWERIGTVEAGATTARRERDTMATARVHPQSAHSI